MPRQRGTWMDQRPPELVVSLGAQATGSLKLTGRPYIPPVRTGTRGGFVFINLDLGCRRISRTGPSARYQETKIRCIRAEIQCWLNRP